MVDNANQSTQSERESGVKLHRRETNWQIYFPFLLGILALIAVFAGLALPSDPVWRDRATAMGDFLYLFFCMIPPFLFCMFPIYLVLLVSIYGMGKLHDGTERPLRKLEDLTANLANRIETVTGYVNERTTQFHETIEPYERSISVFEPHTQTEETTPDV